ncbi:MAG: hypothetical protein ABIT20_17520 [Gemmatimonadaceae bacterium]
MSTIVEVSYGVIGMLGAIAVIMATSWARPLILVWAALITLTAGLAVFAWGGTSLPIALVSAVFAGLIAALIVMFALPSRWNPS